MTDEHEDDEGVTLTVEEFVDYCRTQSGLLWGKIQTMNDDVLELLDEIEGEVTALQADLDASAAETGESLTVTGATAGDLDVESLEARQDEIREKQERIESDQARIRALKDLAEAYESLADELADEATDGRVALSQVVQFEVEREAPAYFPERETMVEVAAKSQDEAVEEDAQQEE